MSVTIFEGSILDAPVDVIVNPANSFLRHGGGLARVIDTAAREIHIGSAVKDWDKATVEDRKTVANPARNAYQSWHLSQGLVPVGDAVLGPPGALCKRFQGIIHAVGPIWGGGDHFERELLTSTYRRSLLLAADHGWSIALPAISAGIFGVPIDVVARCAMDAVFCTPRLDRYFALVDPVHVEAFRRVMDENR